MTDEYLLYYNAKKIIYAQREAMAAVGAKLYYGDNTIQHAGIVLGLGAHRAAVHTHYKASHERLGYMGRLYYARDVSVVTAACLLVKKRYLMRMVVLTIPLRWHSMI